MVTWNRFESREALVEDLARKTLDALDRITAARGEVTWAVSGGSTPKILFEALHQRTFAWDKVQIALVDERWVEIDHPRSNEAFICGALKRGMSAKASFVGMKTPDPDPCTAHATVEDRYRRLPLIGPCLLGVGPDGHTASLFPGAAGLERAMDPANEDMTAAVQAKESPVTGQEVDRMTLTLSAITGAAWPHVLITGEEKRAALEEALAGGALPVARVAAAMPVPLQIFWAP